MIPNSYQAATWRNTLPKDEPTQQVGVGFDLPDGGIVRLSLSVESARNLAETLLQSLSTDHSLSSSGIPSDDVSMFSWRKCMAIKELIACNPLTEVRLRLLKAKKAQLAFRVESTSNTLTKAILQSKVCLLGLKIDEIEGNR